MFKIGQWLLNLLGIGLAITSVQQCCSSAYRKLCLKRRRLSANIPFLDWTIGRWSDFKHSRQTFVVFNFAFSCFLFPQKEEIRLSLGFLQDFPCLLHFFQNWFLEKLNTFFFVTWSTFPVSTNSVQQVQQKGFKTSLSLADYFWFSLSFCSCYAVWGVCV